MTTVEAFAPAKINLTLHVTGRRDDGYHLLDSLVVFARDIGDRISVTTADALTLSVTGPMTGGVPKGADNLVVKAARRLQSLRGVSAGAEITLEKHLPNGAGIGGGSADAAAAIAALAELWAVAPLTPAEALPLGADVPVCLHAPRPALLRGIGDEISPCDGLPSLWLVLVSPLVALSTGEVFGRFDALYGEHRPPMEPLPPDADVETFQSWLLGQVNDLTKVASEPDLAPEVGTILAEFRDIGTCLDTDMSGSGSTCWGLFASVDDASEAAIGLAAQYPAWWIVASRIT